MTQEELKAALSTYLNGDSELRKRVLNNAVEMYSTVTGEHITVEEVEKTDKKLVFMIAIQLE